MHTLVVQSHVHDVYRANGVDLSRTELGELQRIQSFLFGSITS